MDPVTPRIICQEHMALAAMLRSMLLLLAQQQRDGKPPDFQLLHAMLFYIDEFPERLHHPKESGLLFPLLRLRSDEASAVLDHLDQDHEQGQTHIREVQRDLLAYEVLGETRRLAFEDRLQRYTDFYLAHMRTEELVVLPLAQRVLTAQDWQELDAAFVQNRDPLTGHAPDADYVALFSRIVCLAPAPIGLG
jgi:hemerythrin-like domain-containing protein